MKHLPKRKSGERRKRREWIMAAGLIAYLIGLLIRIPLGHMIGDKGVGFFAAGMEIFIISTVILSYGMSKSVTVLIKYRMKREMYGSAKKVFRVALLLALVSGAVISCGIFFFSSSIAQIVVLEDMSYLSIAAVAPAVFLATVMGVLKGYFQGIGTMMPTAHSKLLEKVIMLVSGLILGTVLYTYGLKVAALLKNEEYAAAYGALGASLGITIACVFGILHLLFIYAVYAANFKQQVGKVNYKHTEAGSEILSMLISTSLPYTICGLLYSMNYLVDQRLFNYALNIQGQGSLRVLHWGVYYGKYSAVIGTAAILCTLGAIGAVPKIGQFFDRQDYRAVQEEMGKSIHHLSIVAIPCAVLIAVLAEPIVGVLFTGEVKTAVKLIQVGTAVVVLFAFTYFLAGILQRIRKMQIVILGGLSAFLLHLIVIVLLLNNTSLGITAVVCGNIIFYLTTCVVCFFGVTRYMKYSQEWVRTFAVTLIAAGVTGLIGMLLNKAFLSFVGDAITLLICVFVCFIVYNVLLILLKGVREEELREMPGGKVIVSIAVRLHLM
ncbi:MAG: polysaccharide biosynthesis protein [Clostridiales bacterium]|nr:polysaccharide biosynthesis protein [Clostridiales bacterium]